MNSPALEKTSWDWRCWLVCLLLIFAAQFLLIYFLSSRAPVSTSSQPTRMTLQIFPKPWTELQLAEKYLASDPTLFAMPNSDGFSGNAWLNVPARDYDLSEQIDPPFWLPLNSQQLGNAANRFVRTNFFSLMKLAENSRPTIVIAQIFDLGDSGKTNSLFRLEGGLASRELLDLPQLKSWPGVELLGKSIAQIAVDKSGTVISARLVARSGSGEADRAALETARQLQFAPALEELVWGNVIFDWLTIPAATPNAGAIQ